MRTTIVPSHLRFYGLLLFAFSLGLGARAASGQENKSPGPGNQKWNYNEIKRTPKKASQRPNPLENDPDAPLAGGKLFQQHCAECHGLKGEGGKWAPSLLRDEVRQAPPGAIFWVLSNGVVWHGMPDWTKLPEPERWQLVSFLKAFRAPAAPGGPAEAR